MTCSFQNVIWMLALKRLEKFDNLFESPKYSVIATFILSFHLLRGLHVHCLQIKPVARHPLCVKHLFGYNYSNRKRVPIIEINTEVKYVT